LPCVLAAALARVGLSDKPEEARPHYFRFLLINPNGEALLADIARP
jgi:hypothetical protein